MFELSYQFVYTAVTSVASLGLGANDSPEDLDGQDRLLTQDHQDRIEAVVDDIKRTLRFEPDLAHAIALMVRRVIAARDDIAVTGSPRAFATDIALVCAGAMAKSAGYEFDVARAGRELPAAVRRQDAPVSLPRTVQGWIRRAGGTDQATHVGPTNPAPGLELIMRSAEPFEDLRVFVATPLTQVTQAEHDLLLPMARAAAQILKRWAFRAYIPGETLSPEASDSDDDVVARFEREQNIIANSDLIVLVGCDADSWGMSKTATWAEASTIPILMLGTDVKPWCRVLSAGPNVLRHEVIDTPADLADTVDDAMGTLFVHALRHAHERIALTAALEPLLEQARQQLARTAGKVEQSTAIINQARARHVLTSSSLLMGASLYETRGLSAYIEPTTLDDLVRATLAYAAASSGRWTDIASHRQLGSTQFLALNAAALDERWDADNVHTLLHHFFTVDTPHRRAAQTRFGSASDWKRLASRLDIKPRKRP